MNGAGSSSSSSSSSTARNSVTNRLRERRDAKDFMKPQFDHEKLDVYQVELRFIAWVTPLFEEVRNCGKPKIGEVSDHLDRASLSALLNTSEGNGKRQRPVRAKFFDDARGSATECAACLDALVAKGACDIGRVQEGKDLLLRVVSMLSKLVNRYSEDLHLKEEAADYGRDEQAPA